MNRFIIIDVIRIALSAMFMGLGLALLPGRSRLNPAIDKITRGLDYVSDELRKDHL